MAKPSTRGSSFSGLSEKRNKDMHIIEKPLSTYENLGGGIDFPNVILMSLYVPNNFQTWRSDNKFYTYFSHLQKIL